MSKKKIKSIQDASKKKKPSTDFLEGSDYVQALYESALSKVFGKKAGIKASKYLLSLSLKKMERKIKPKKNHFLTQAKL